MSDYISREAAIEAFDDPRVERNYGDVDPDSVIRVIEAIPAADVREVKRGKWVAWYGAVRCVECGHDTIIKSNFCPNCGARMEEQP